MNGQDELEQPGASRIFLTACALLTALVLAGILAGIPLFRGPLAGAHRSPAMRFVPLALTGLLPLGALAWLLRRALAGRVRPRTFGLLAAALAYLALLLFAAAAERGWFALPLRIYDPAFTGTYSDALGFPSLGSIWSEYLARWDELTPHGQTHPPGPAFLFALTTRAAAVLTSVANALAPLTGEAQRSLLSFQIEGNLPAFLLPLLAQLWLWPLYHAARALYSRRIALAAVALGASLPATLLLLPLVDQLLPIFALATLVALDRAARGRGLRHAALAGGLFGLGLLLSYSLLPLLMVYGLFLAARIEKRPPWGEAAGIYAIFLAAAAALLLAVYLLAGFNWWSAALRSLTQHTGWTEGGRSYLLFLFYSPYAFFLWLGPPLALALGARLAHARRADPLALPASATLLVMVLLGTTRGETQRLWLPLMPFIALPASAALAHRAALLRRPWLCLGLLWLCTFVLAGWLPFG